MIRIPSPEPLLELPADTGVLLVATVSVLGLAGLTIASHLHTRWAALRRMPLLGLHVVISALAVLGAVVPLGIAVLAPTGLAGGWGLASGVLVGLLIADSALPTEELDLSCSPRLIAVGSQRNRPRGRLKPHARGSLGAAPSCARPG